MDGSGPGFALLPKSTCCPTTAAIPSRTGGFSASLVCGTKEVLHDMSGGEPGAGIGGSGGVWVETRESEWGEAKSGGWW